MAITPMGLGRGLDSLIRETRNTKDAEGVQNLPLKDIAPNPNQPRRVFTEKSLEELADSIKSQGLLQPILVRPLGDSHPGRYEIVAGERRWRACKLAGLQEVPVLVRLFSVQDTLTAALIENLQREDLNPIEEALGLFMLKEEFGLSQEDLAAKLGKSRPAVANALRLLALPQGAQKDITEGRLSAGHARTLLSITEPLAQEELRITIVAENLSVREAEGMAATWKATGALRPSTASLVHDNPAEGNQEKTAAPSPLPLSNGVINDALGNEEASAEPAPPLPKAQTTQKSAPQSAIVLDLQTRLCKTLGLPVRVIGKENSGKINLTYNSKEELYALLGRLGLEEPSPVDFIDGKSLAGGADE